MLFLEGLVVAAVLAATGKTLKKRPGPYYVGAVVLTAVTALGDFSRAPAFFRTYMVDPVTHGALAGALWAVVMWTGALKNGSRLMKILAPIRGEMSIIASLLTLGHNFTYGKMYYTRLFTDPLSLPLPERLATVLSLIMLALLLPLTVTSFRTVRRLMKVRVWKRIQRLAYLFYALQYVHIMLVTAPGAAQGRESAVFNAVVYTLVYGSYAVCRIRKKMLSAHVPAGRSLLLSLGLSAVALCLVFSLCRLTGTGAAPDQGGGTGTGTSGAGQILEGQAYGYDGYIRVRVTLTDGSITSVSAVSEEMDPAYFDMARGQVIREIIARQSPRVDAVSGATVSSEAIMEAVENALAQNSVP